MKVQLNLNTMVKKVAVRGVGLKSLDLVWTVLRKAEIEIQTEYTLRFFGGLYFGLKSVDLVWTVLRKPEIELQIEHTLHFFGGLSVKISSFSYSRNSANGHLSKTAFFLSNPYIDSRLNLFITATSFCPQGGRCGEVQQYVHMLKKNPENKKQISFVLFSVNEKQN